MVTEQSNRSNPPAAPPLQQNDVRRVPDAVDLRILALLEEDARIPNSRLAAEVGLAPSTCLNRVRGLVESGTITGFHAEVDPRSLGFPLEALVSVAIRSGARASIGAFLDEVGALPEIRQVFFLGGAEDFVLHVAITDSDHLREFVVSSLSGHPSVASTRTSVVFAHQSPRPRRTR